MVQCDDNSFFLSIFAILSISGDFALDYMRGIVYCDE